MMDRRVPPLSEPTRELRRLGRSSTVTTTYVDHRGPTAAAVVDDEVEASRGYNDGYARGIADAEVERERLVRDEQERLRRASAALASAAHQLREAREELRREFERHVPDLVFALVSEILGHELRTSENPGRAALERALRECAEVTEATVHMNPEDLKSLGDVSDLVAERAVVVVSDDAIESGGVMVEAGEMTLDVRVDTALERIRRALSVGLAGVSDDRAA